MKYPKIKPELDRRLKFLPEQREQIIKEYNSGRNICSLAKQYGVCHATIKSIVDPIYREERNKFSRERNARKRLNSAWVKRHRKLTNESHRYKRAVMALEEKAYDKEQLKEWRKKNPEKWAKIMEKHRKKKLIIK